MEKTLYPVVLNNVLGSVIGRKDYTRCDIRAFVVNDIISEMRAMSSSSFVDEVVDEIMQKKLL